MAYIGKTPTSGDFVLLDSITTSATASYTMQKNSVNFEPQSANHMIVSLNGTIQAPVSSFTVSGSTLTFASALTSSDVIDFILVLGNVNDVGTATTVVDSAITNNKLNLISTSSTPGLTVKGDGSSENGTIQLNCSQNSHGVKLSSPDHSAGQSYELILPTGNVTADKFLKVASVSGSGTTGIGQLSFSEVSGGNHVQLASVESTSNDGTISIQDKFTATYDFYRFFLQWKQTTDGSDTRFRWLKGGSTEESGSHYIYVSDRHEINSTPSSYAGTDHQGYNQSYALVANHLPANSEAHFHTLDWTIYNPYKGSPSGRAKVMGMKTYVRTDSTWRGGTISIEYDSGDSSNQYGGFKLFPSTGYMTDYKYQLYGVKFS